MSSLDKDDAILRAIYDNAVWDSDYDFSKVESNPEVQQAVSYYAEKNNYSYDDAWLAAAGIKNGASSGDTAGHGYSCGCASGKKSNLEIEYAKWGKVFEQVSGWIMLVVLILTLPLIIYGETVVKLLSGFILVAVVMAFQLICLKHFDDYMEKKEKEQKNR